MSKLPDFLICGFQKSGTTALVNNLTQHDQINLARTKHINARISNGKEINFFSSEDNPASTYKEGIDWYKSHFLDDDGVWGEASPGYSDYTNVTLSRMGEHLSQTKFIFSIRNPIHRAFSAYNMYMQLLEEDGVKFGAWNPQDSLIDNVKNHPYVFRRNYIEVLKLYEKQFSRNQIHVIIFEKLKTANYQTEYDKIFKFLNVGNCFIKNQDHHSRPYNRKITQEETYFFKDLFKEEVNELFNWLGYEITEWEEFC
tara:strand:- start:274 stop:1038 length:765 start_codon:yes stop_codon:yes gene_type:complete